MNIRRLTGAGWRFARRQRRAVKLAAGAAVLLLLALAGGVYAWNRPSAPLQQLVEVGWRRVRSDVAYRLMGWQMRTPVTEVNVQVNLGYAVRDISPRIYGGAAMGPNELKQLRLTVNRWGGNSNTRYNWVLGNAWNAARDWEFRNGNYGRDTPADRVPSGHADQFIRATLDAGAEAVITIPSIGWVAKDTRNSTQSINVPYHSAPPLALGAVTDAIPGYDPTANRQRTSVPSFARKGAPFVHEPPQDGGAVYQDEWVGHLVQEFGSAAQGGVGYYVVDNEPDLWSHTHTDVHPAQQGYEEMLANFVEYAEAIKDVDPTALVRGPAVSGWTGMEYSPLDRGTDDFRRHAERRAHGNVPFLEWWLNAVAERDVRLGRRTLDVLDVHFYPQGNGVFYPAYTDSWTNALRLRSTRALWDPTYTDESWIREPIALIPRLRSLIDSSYPGTKLAIGEWSWGADNTLNGALAIAEVLGIFGREGVDMAEYWPYPAPGSPGAAAFALYVNADRQGGGFGTQSLHAVSDAPDVVSVFAGGQPVTNTSSVILINKQAEGVMSTLLQISALPSATARMQLYRLDATAPTAVRYLGDLEPGSALLHLELPAQSATLLRITP